MSQVNNCHEDVEDKYFLQLIIEHKKDLFFTPDRSHSYDLRRSSPGDDYIILLRQSQGFYISS
jgi:hypothetical protein